MRKKRRVRSVPQRNLMGYAYACATGKAKDCPDTIKDVAKSFLKKNKKEGLKSLRRMAKTKHTRLSPVKISEASVISFTEFSLLEMHYWEQDDSSETIQWLYKIAQDLNLIDLYPLIHDYLTDSDKQSKLEYIEEIKNILIEKGSSISNEQIEQVEKSLKKRTLNYDNNH